MIWFWLCFVRLKFLVLTGYRWRWAKRQVENSQSTVGPGMDYHHTGGAQKKGHVMRDGTWQDLMYCTVDVFSYIYIYYIIRYIHLSSILFLFAYILTHQRRQPFHFHLFVHPIFDQFTSVLRPWWAAAGWSSPGRIYMCSICATSDVWKWWHQKRPKNWYHAKKSQERHEVKHITGSVERLHGKDLFSFVV